MTYMPVITGVATAATTAADVKIAQAIKASGAIVSVKKDDFMSVLSKAEKPLVILTESGYRKKKYKYLMGYKGLVFYTKSNSPLQLTSSTELVTAKKIWIPG